MSDPQMLAEHYFAPWQARDEAAPSDILSDRS